MLIKLQKPYMYGAAVKRIQEMLQTIGFFLSGEIDGVFGPYTDSQVVLFQSNMGLLTDGIVGPNTMGALLAESSVVTQVSPVLTMDGTKIVDITQMHPKPRNYRSGGRKVGIDAITLHQTGCDMPSDPTGWGRVNIHYGIMQSGVPIRINPIQDMIWHAQGLSRRSIGIEIEGNFMGDVDTKWSLWKPGGGPHKLNSAMLHAAMIILEDIRRQVTIKHVFAHRQSSETRRACPGGEIWQCIGIPFREMLGCPQSDLTLSMGRGTTIPAAWDPQGKGRY